MVRVFRFVYVSTLCLIAAMGFERAWPHEMPPYHVESASAQFQPGSIDFRPCPQDATLECGRLTLPVDYDRPVGETFWMAVIRAPATKPARRIGVLMHSPAQPGRSGVDFVADRVRTPTFERLRQRFDVVSFDLRSFAPDTNNVARDMDALRRALGEKEITFLGPSYGSRIGAVYASLYPERVRAMVLDGALPPGHLEAEPPVIRDVSQRLEHPILIIGIDFDNAAPLESSQHLAHALGMERSLIRYQGSGHTAFPAAGSICIDLAVEAYLFDLAVPAAGTRCPAQPIHFHSLAPRQRGEGWGEGF